MANASPTRELIDRDLTENGVYTLDELVTKLRDTGTSWDNIAYEIRQHTGHSVSGQTLRRWYN